MSSPKSVIITFPKGLPEPKAVQANELTRGALPRLNFTTSILTDKTRMDARKILQVSPKQEEMRSDDDDFATFIKTADACVRGKKRRLDHLTWEEKLQRKWVKDQLVDQFPPMNSMLSFRFVENDARLPVYSFLCTYSLFQYIIHDDAAIFISDYTFIYLLIYFIFIYLWFIYNYIFI